MLRLKLEKKDIEYISEKYSLDDVRFIENIYNEVSSFYVDVKLQHLASIIRCLEFRGRDVTHNDNFRIDWGEMGNNSKEPHGMYFKKENRFTISLPKGTEDEQLRCIVAHELGHLFYLLEIMKGLEKKINELDIVEYENFKQKFIADKNKLLHKKANIFGAIIILERSEFYKKKVPEMEEIINRTVEQVIDQFNW